ncbi:MAG: AAA family ATPase, partial [Clostridia bacterium]|nr:AAA family ATPase [Clostridia bacterium]
MFYIQTLMDMISGTSVFQLASNLTQMLISGCAIMIYIATLLVVITVMIFTMLFSDGKKETSVLTDNPADASDTMDAIVENESKQEETAPRGERFCMLSDIDRNKGKFEYRTYEKGITLEIMCEDFRNYAANKLKLYYSIDDIRRFIAGLAVSHLLILQGMSGTGKTSLAHAFGSYIDNTATVIPVQPMWKERTDLIGYYNEFTKRFNETLLLEKMYEANYSKDMYITVLDEMNIARVEYYFAEFLSLLELPDPDERYLEVVSDRWDNDPAQLKDGRVKLPINMWFIGTANNDDSTFAISDKVYDRAMIMNLDAKSERFAAPSTGKKHISAAQFEDLVEKAQKEYAISSRNLRRLEELDKYLIEHFHITFGNRIMKQIKTYIPVYVSCGGQELAALDDILAKKVIRKLETQNPIYLRNTAEGLISHMEELFGNDGLPLCKEHIRRL